MKIGKTYIINPTCKATFADECPQNADMVSLIEIHGPSFTVNDMVVDDDDDISIVTVTGVTMQDGSKFYAAGKPGSFFEIYEDEFKYFVEVSPESFQPIDLCYNTINKDSVSGVTKIHCIVDENNVDEIIELLRKTFKK